LNRKIKYSRTKSFNPRPRTEGDSNDSLSAFAHLSFNPRPRTEGDSQSYPYPDPNLFQSAPSHGGRRFDELLSRICIAVSIRALARRATCSAATCRQGRRVSIRALARRATGQTCSRRILRRVSIRALARRATAYVETQDFEGKFQSAPSHGGRPPGIRATVASRYPFQSAPSHGGRLEIRIGEKGIWMFQSAPSHGGRPERRVYGF